MGENRNQTTGRRATALLTGDLRRTLFLLALPVLAEQFLNSFVSFVDLFLSGHLSPDPTSELNQHATSAIGVAAYMGWLATMLFGFVGVGTTALVSRHWGANEHDEANRIANRSIALSLVLGVAVCLLFRFQGPHAAVVARLDKLGLVRRSCDPRATLRARERHPAPRRRRSAADARCPF
ncbi:MAG: hypothetical protein IID46_00120 [Planctomycetes bacterium]|nr:hypothetical protein [Planctomycetota bacterium]